MFRIKRRWSRRAVGRPSRPWLKSCSTVMLLASLRVAASKCCHALAMPAGGQEEAAGHEVLEQIEKLPRVDYYPRVDRSRGIASCHADPLRFAHRRDQERTDTWDSSGMYRFSSLRKSFVRTNEPVAQPNIDFKGCQTDGQCFKQYNPIIR